MSPEEIRKDRGHDSRDKRSNEEKSGYTFVDHLVPDILNFAKHASELCQFIRPLPFLIGMPSLRHELQLIGFPRFCPCSGEV
jgi:hypothetical protein